MCLHFHLGCPHPLLLRFVERFCNIHRDEKYAISSVSSINFSKAVTFPTIPNQRLRNADDLDRYFGFYVR